MSTISAGTTTTTAFKVTSDTTGSLLLKTGASGATAIDIDAAQVVSIGNIAVTGGTINNTIIGGTTAVAGSFTTLTAASTVTLNGGTANGVAYLNGSKNLTTGSALTFDGSNALGFGTGGTGSTAAVLTLKGSSATNYGAAITGTRNGSGSWFIGNSGTALGGGATGFIYYNYTSGDPWIWYDGGASAERMRLTSTGLGIGTTSPAYKLSVAGASGSAVLNLLETGVRSWGVRAGGTATNTFDIADFTAGATRLTIDSSGNLGINTTSPAAKLHVVNSTPNSGKQTLFLDSNYGNAGDSVASIRATVNNNAGGTYIWGLTSESVLAHNMEFISGSNYVARSTTASYLSQAGGVFSFYSNQSLTAGNAFTPTERMRLDTSGNLGIGTASPQTKLAVETSGTQNVVSPVVTGQTAGVTYGGMYTVRDGAGDQRGLAWQVFTANVGLNEKMRLDSSGSLGLGVTPSAWASSYKSFQLGSTASLVGATNFTFLNTNVYFDSSDTPRYLTTAAATRYQQDGGAHKWFYAASGTAGNAISFTQAMTLDASGRLLISAGASAPNDATGFWLTNQTGVGPTISGLNFTVQTGSTGSQSERMRLDSSGNLGIGTASPAAKLTVYGSAGAAYIQVQDAAGVTGKIQARASTNLLEIGTTSNNGLSLYTNNTERARIDSNGRVIINGTTQLYTSTLTLYRTGNSYNLTSTVTSTANEGHVVFENGNGAVGTIFTNGTATAYNTSSDYRLKNTIAPMTGALAKVALLKPCTYKWNADGSDGQGFIAHELAEVVPQCVTGEKDAMDAEGKPQYQGVDTSFLVATLTAAIQELTARVASLESK